MENSDFKNLLERYFDDSLSHDEWKSLLKYLHKEEFQRQLRQEIEQALYNNKFKALADEDRADMLFQHIMDAAAEKEKKKKKVRVYKMNWFKVAVAAAILIVVSAGWLWHKHFSSGETIVANNIDLNKNDVPPGKSKATLTLSNGSVISLDSAGNGSLARQGSTQIMKQNGKLLYSSQGNNKADKIFYNTVSTPRGGQYQLVLPDSTTVWLNAASSLKFPTAFIGNDREVTLTGEAYFEVVKNKSKPFKVNVGKMQVEDLGTHFNINAYKDEPVIKTTLLEGAVSVSEGKKSVLLNPGQQAVIGQAADLIKVQSTDVNEAIAWKNEKFSFNHTNIYEVMRQISRWYNVDVKFQDSLNVFLSGKIRRNVYASEVFKMLEVVGEAKFKINGRIVIVKK